MRNKALAGSQASSPANIGAKAKFIKAAGIDITSILNVTSQSRLKYLLRKPSSKLSLFCFFKYGSPVQMEAYPLPSGLDSGLDRVWSAFPVPGRVFGKKPPLPIAQAIHPFRGDSVEQSINLSTLKASGAGFIIALITEIRPVI